MVITRLKPIVVNTNLKNHSLPTLSNTLSFLLDFDLQDHSYFSFYKSNQATGLYFKVKQKDFTCTFSTIQTSLERSYYAVVINAFKKVDSFRQILGHSYKLVRIL